LIPSAGSSKICNDPEDQQLWKKPFLYKGILPYAVKGNIFEEAQLWVLDLLTYWEKSQKQLTPMEKSQ
jgi:hypothetical protein